MQKLNNFIYMIAATFVANLVYTMDALHNYAMAVYYCPQEIRTVWATLETAAASEVNALRATCDDVCRRNTFSRSYMNSYSIGSGREAWGNAYYCVCLYRSTYARTTAMPVYRSCGVLYSCDHSDATIGTDPYQSYEVYTSGNAGYAAFAPGMRGQLTDISCCPGTGTNGELAYFLGMGSNVYVASPYVVVHSYPDANNITQCYAQAQDGFSDPSGTWVYVSDCRYQQGY